MSQLTSMLPAPSGVLANFFGDSTGGATTRYYWVQAIYPSGRSILARSNALASMPSSLNRNNQVEVSWNPMAGAIGYNVYYTTSTTAPTNGSILCGTVTGSNFTDTGQSNAATLQTGYVIPDGVRQARARYDFAVDGGAISTIALALADTVPAGAIILAIIANPTVALTSLGSATISIGLSAGGTGTAALKALTAVATYSLDAVLAGVPSFAVPVKTTADGLINVSIAVAALTAGVMDIQVLYVMPVNL